MHNATYRGDVLGHPSADSYAPARTAEPAVGQVADAALEQIDEALPSKGATVELHVRTLQGHDRHTLVHDFHFHAEPGTVNLLMGATPAARWALACVLAGRLPSDRFTFNGEVAVAGRRSAPALRSLVSLAQPWRIRRSETELDRRLRALDWAEPMDTPLVILSPGLDGLEPAQRAEVIDRGRAIAARGITVIITAGSVQPGDLDDRDPLSGTVGTIGGKAVNNAA